MSVHYAHPEFLDVIKKAGNLSFYADTTGAVWTNGTLTAVWKPYQRYKDMFLTLRAGEITFSDFISVLELERGIMEESYHN